MSNESKIIELLHQKIRLLEVPDNVIDAVWCNEMKEINDALEDINKTKTYCVECGSDDTVEIETGNGGILFAAEDMDGDIEYVDPLELWQCNSCKERFFK